MSYQSITVNAPLAMSYVPWQAWGGLFDEKKALERGTAFAALYLPFCAGGGQNERA